MSRPNVNQSSNLAAWAPSCQLPTHHQILHSSCVSVLCFAFSSRVFQILNGKQGKYENLIVLCELVCLTQLYTICSCLNFWVGEGCSRLQSWLEAGLKLKRSLELPSGKCQGTSFIRISLGNWWKILLSFYFICLPFSQEAEIQGVFF